MSEHSKNGTALQVLQTILVAVLLGVTGWLANAVIQNREDNVKLRTQFEERKATIDEMQRVHLELTKTEQEILREIISMKDADAQLRETAVQTERRLSALERSKNP